MKLNKFLLLGLLVPLMLVPGLLYHSVSGPGLLVEKAPYQWVLVAGFSVLIAPLVETLVFQHGLIRWIHPRLSFVPDGRRWGSAVLFSALLFGLAHASSPLRFFLAVLAGLLLGGTYWLFSIRKDWHPAVVVFLLHACNNLLSFLHQYGPALA